MVGNSNNNVASAMSDSLAGVLGSSSFASTLLGLAGVSGVVDAAVRNNLAKVQTRITEKDVRDAIATVIAKCNGNVNDPNVINACRLIEAMEGQPAWRLDQLMAGAVEAAINSAQGKAADANDPSDVQQAWARYDQANRRLNTLVADLPMTEQERRDYEELQRREEEARRRMNDPNLTAEQRAAAAQEFRNLTQDRTEIARHAAAQGVANNTVSPERAAQVNRAADEVERTAHVAAESASPRQTLAEQPANAVQSAPAAQQQHPVLHLAGLGETMVNTNVVSPPLGPNHAGNGTGQGILGA